MEPVGFSAATESVLLLQMGKLREAPAKPLPGRALSLHRGPGLGVWLLELLEPIVVSWLIFLGIRIAGHGCSGAEEVADGRGAGVCSGPGKSLAWFCKKSPGSPAVPFFPHRAPCLTPFFRN